MKIKPVLFFLLIFFNPLWTESPPDSVQISKAEKIFSAMIAQIGDLSNLHRIRTIGRTTQPMTKGSLTFVVEVIVDFPDKFLLKFQGDEYLVIKDKGWKKYPQGYYENLSSSVVNLLIENLHKNLIYLIFRQNEFLIEYQGDAVCDSISCHLLKLSDGKSEFDFYISKESSLPLQLAYYKIEGKTTRYLMKKYLAFTSYAGILYPVHTLTIDTLGTILSEVVIDSVFINPEEAAEFE